MSTKRNITARDIDAARRLTRVYEARKYGPERMTQTKLAESMGFNQQVSVSQYLNGKLPFSIEAVANFAKALGCDPAEILPSFFDELHLTRDLRTDRLVAVKCTLTGAEPTTAVVKTAIKEGLVSEYAVQIDSNLYRKAGIKEGAFLIINEGVEFLADDDVYVEMTDGQKYIATYMGYNDLETQHILRDLATDDLIERRDDEIKTIEVIAGVENPVRVRDVRAK